MENKTRNKKAQIDWMITIVPLTIVIALCILFFFLPEQSNVVLGKIRFFFGDTFGTYYLIIGLGIFILSNFLLVEILFLDGKMKNQNIRFLLGEP